MTDIRDWLRPISRDIRLNGDKRSLSMRRHYDTTPEDLWDAWTNPERTHRWMGEITGDLREGGEIFLQMEPDCHATCRIVRCDPPHRLVTTWHYADEPETAVELRLTQDGERTLLQLEHVGFDQPTHVAAYGPGWEDFLVRLDRHLDGEDPADLKWSEVKEVLEPMWSPVVDNPVTDTHRPFVNVVGETATLEANWTYAAPPQEVWAAFTSPERLTGWFADVTIDGREWTATFNGGKASGKVEICEKATELATSWQWEHEESPSRVRITLESTAEGTHLRLVESAVNPKSATGYAAGWHAHLAGLAKHLAGHDPVDADWDADFILARKAI